MAGSVPATGAQLFKRFAQAAATFSKPRAVRTDMPLTCCCNLTNLQYWFEFVRVE